MTSDRYASNNAYNLWYNLLQDKNLYCFTSKTMSGLISKSLDDIEIEKVINKIKKLKIDDIEFDDELQEKISFF